jgi:hypothetical protein
MILSKITYKSHKRDPLPNPKDPTINCVNTYTVRLLFFLECPTNKQVVGKLLYRCYMFDHCCVSTGSA